MEEGFVTAPCSISPQPNFAESDGRMKSSIIAQGELKAPRKGRRMEGKKTASSGLFSLRATPEFMGGPA